MRELIKSNFLRGYPFVVAIILFAAATLKLWEYGTSPTLGLNIIDHPAVLLAGSCLELLLAFWLCAGIFPRALRLVGIAFFATAAIVSIYEAAHGYASCGCFGPLRTSPKMMAMLDVVILICFTMGKFTSSPPSSWSKGYLAAGVFFAMGAVSCAIIFHPKLKEERFFARSGNAIVLRPDAWVGQQFPLMTFTNIGSTLAKGTWRVVLFHVDCPICRDVISNVQQDVHSAIIEVPSDIASPQVMGQESKAQCRVGTLDSTIKWYVTTPVILYLQNGIVRREHSGNDAWRLSEVDRLESP